MGLITNGILGTFSPYEMKGKVYVKNKAGQSFSSVEKTYKDFEHVEHHLMSALYDHYSGFDNIPNSTNIIFCCPWSPCKKCVEQEIPEFLRVSKVLSRGIRVKFRFVNYYVRSAWEAAGLTVRPDGGRNFYASIDQANAAYLKLMENYGAVDTNFESGENDITITTKRNVVIAKSTVQTKIVTRLTMEQLFGD